MSKVPRWGQMHTGQVESLSSPDFPATSNINSQLQPTALFTDFQHPCHFSVPVIMLTQTMHLEYLSSSCLTIKIMPAIYYYPAGCIHPPHLCPWRIFVSILQMKKQRLNKVKHCIQNIQLVIELKFKLWSVLFNSNPCSSHYSYSLKTSSKSTSSRKSSLTTQLWMASHFLFPNHWLLISTFCPVGTLGL